MKTFISIVLFFLSLSISAQNADDEKVYAKENISISLQKSKDLGEDVPNYHLVIAKNKKIIFEDSVYSKVGEMELRDFNGDGIKDILIQNISDVRSNWTYFLYLYDRKSKNFTKIKDFETIKNPEYNKEYRLIESYTVSGRDYIQFYKFVGNTVKNLGETVYDDHSDNDDYDDQYQKVLEKISK
ncbi:hypothetical protein LUD75_14235 [Epilithonimonas sp. JDS]|uniref:XAC2610-related protein n=1 Tax=Epilithonimonas sp. JDS TaxID=2902797 RepID=UPI001E538818|nr:hypothetical protein [Epilithonimonas sp. JDS]MCD9855880.1 hypothetical protein [Epilithonimonas sp. JDS]